jgi:hypothetical protein
VRTSAVLLLSATLLSTSHTLQYEVGETPLLVHHGLQAIGVGRKKQTLSQSAETAETMVDPRAAWPISTVLTV